MLTDLGYKDTEGKFAPEGDCEEVGDNGNCDT